MSLNRKLLGLALVGMVVIGALLAPAAQAEENTPTFTATESPVRETGTQVEAHEITVNAGTLKCKGATLLDSSGAGGMMLVMQPSYTECTVGGVAATVKMNGCEYTFEPTKTTEGEDRYAGRMGILCPTGKTIEVSTSGCLVTIGEQINLETVEFANATAAKQVEYHETWQTSVKSAEYMQTGALCKGGTGVFKNLTYHGVSTIKGESPTTGEPIGIWIGD
ncbi:MAG TPA: hypothetical protein VMT37_10200 [Solirubrobacterales bacterium]|nr:hypothetical protein [Solirubrobacterales bacterium]